MPGECGFYVVTCIGHKNVVVLPSFLSDAVNHRFVIGFRPMTIGKPAGELLRRVYSYFFTRERYATGMSPERFLCKRCLELLQASGTVRRANQHTEKG